MTAPRHRRTTICLEGWYYLVVMGFVLAAAIVRDINLLMVMFGLMLGGLLFSFRAATAMLRDLEVRRRLPAMVSAGDEFAVELEVRNPRKKRGSWAVVVRDEIRRTATDAQEPPQTPSLLFTHIPPGQIRRVSYQGILPRRGLYQLGPLRISTRFPLGLIRRTWTMDVSDRLVVHPRLGRLTSRWRQQQNLAEDGVQQQQRPLGTSAGDYHGLRDWRPGDSRRWIHWRTSARRGELMVRQYEQPRNHDLVLILELWLPARTQETDRARLETVLSFAATVVEDRCRRGGGSMTLGIAGEKVTLLRGSASPALLQEAMESLALAAGSSHDRLPKLLNETLGEFRPGAELAVVSTRPVDAADTARFGEIWSDARKQSAFTKGLLVDAGGPEFSAWFQGEGAP